MAEYDLVDESLVGVLVRTRVRQFEEKHPGSSVYAADARGIWEVRITYGKEKEKHGSAYIGSPLAPEWLIRIIWPPGGGLGDIEKMDFLNTAGLEGLILHALEMEGMEPVLKKQSP
ncbi:MAG: hypothetical protein LUQ49_03755, partial [Methanomicrobiales archaeon]|nr:hypothetical protein [Methanomicrobiales archaeon]